MVTYCSVGAGRHYRGGTARYIIWWEIPAFPWAALATSRSCITTGVSGVCLLFKNLVTFFWQLWARRAQIQLGILESSVVHLHAWVCF